MMRKSQMGIDYSRASVRTSTTRKATALLYKRYAQLLRLRKEVRLLTDSRPDRERRPH